MTMLQTATTISGAGAVAGLGAFLVCGIILLTYINQDEIKMFIKRLFLILLVLASTACTKEYYFDTPDIVISIDNNQNLSNSNTNTNEVVANGGQSSSNSVAENVANADAYAVAVNQTLIDQGTHGASANDDGNNDIVTTAFGFVSSEFDVSTDGNTVVGYVPEYSAKTNLNNFFRKPELTLAAIGDLNLVQALKTNEVGYGHKFDPNAREFRIWAEGGSETATSTIIVLISPEDLLTTQELVLDLAAGNYNFSYDASLPAGTNVADFLPFTISGTFRAYGQDIEVVRNVQSDWSYFTIDKRNLANTTPTIDGASMNEELQVTIHDGFSGDYWWKYVRNGFTYQFSFPYDIDLDNRYDPTADTNFDKIARISNTTIEIDKNIHYNCIVNIHREDAQSNVFGRATFPTFIFQSKEINFYIGGIDLQQTFNIDEAFFTDNSIPTFWGHDTTNGDIRWFRHEYGLNNFIRPDGNTPAESVEVVIDGVVVDTLTGFSESELVKRAIALLSGVVINDAPIVTAINDSVMTGEAYTVGVNATDPEGDTLTYTWAIVSGAGADAAESRTTSTFTASHAVAGERVFDVTVSDGTNEVTVRVTATVEEPAASVADDDVDITVTTGTFTAVTPIGGAFPREFWVSRDRRAAFTNGDTLTIYDDNGTIWLVTTVTSTSYDSVNDQTRIGFADFGPGNANVSVGFTANVE